ncbi:MAG: HD domain-containing protein [Clostridiales bacterium]|nr:HD domain-containing protein [Clostridiales bacterium]
MTSIFYIIVLIVSLLLSAAYVYIWHKHFDVNLTIIFTLVPVACLGYALISLSKTLEGALTSTKIVYIGGSFLQLFIALSIFNLCKIDLHKWVRTLMFAVSTLVYIFVLTIGYKPYFYKSVTMDIVNGTPVLIKEYGVLHTVYYVILCLFFLAGIVTIIYSWFRKKDVPRRILLLLVIPNVICLISYFIGKKIVSNMDLLVIGYLIAQVTYLLIAYRMNLYDVGNTAIDSMVHEKGIGYISFDFKYRYLGSNEVARRLVPELNDIAVDETFGYKPAERKIRHFLEDFKSDPDSKSNAYTLTVHDHDVHGSHDDDRYYNVTVSYLYDGNRKRGYLVTFTDDTENKRYIRLLDNYNEDLQREVRQKTEHIIQMHDNLIMSLAVMVESRDNSTGGHIRRTSEGVRILVDEILKDGELKLSDSFCRNIIKAAPMHDLGKIAVDDVILRKPGRFEPEEYEKMKMHAAEGARVIHEILKNTDDEDFKVLAENVAHYHHERWDGSGYPDRLKGEEIPLEARIMAIADVYDALVSKRIYKEAYDYEKANRIILEGMGTQFDPALKHIYENARPRLEEYYKSV